MRVAAARNGDEADTASPYFGRARNDASTAVAGPTGEAWVRG
jgi:hypothetical protein